MNTFNFHTSMKVIYNSFQSFFPGCLLAIYFLSLCCAFFTLHVLCKFALLSLHLKEQQPVPVSMDWFVQGDMFIGLQSLSLVTLRLGQGPLCFLSSLLEEKYQFFAFLQSGSVTALPFTLFLTVSRDKALLVVHCSV